MQNSSLKKCSICNRNLSLIDDYYYNKKGKLSFTWCKKCHIERGKDFRNTPIGKMTEMKKDAKRNGIEFTLALQDIEKLWQQPCSYCTNPLKLVSLDRIDNNVGYTIENVVPCCRWCNYTKGTGSLSFFYKQCQRVVDTMPKSFQNLGDEKDGGQRFPAIKALR